MIECNYCNGVYDSDCTKCPNCGASRELIPKPPKRDIVTKNEEISLDPPKHSPKYDWFGFGIRLLETVGLLAWFLWLAPILGRIVFEVPPEQGISALGNYTISVVVGIVFSIVASIVLGIAGIMLCGFIIWLLDL